MSNTKKIKAGLVLQDPSEFVGHAGTLFYNPDTGTMYLSDGVTPGGISLGQGGGGGGFSGNYNDLTHKPNLQVYATTTYVDNKATWGNITGKPSFATVATTGNYNDLTNKPSIPSISGLASETFVNSAVAGKVDSSSLALVATSGSYNDLEYKPTISTVGHTGNYEDLHNKPTIPSITGLATETYVTTRGYITTADLTGYALTTAIPTNVSDLTNDTGFITSSDLPDLSGYALTTDIPTDVANLTDINGLLGQGGQGGGFSGSYNDLTDTPTLFSGSYLDLTDTPSLFSGDYNDLTNRPSLFSGSYNDLTDTPSLFSGDYNDLTNKPSIPSSTSDLTNDSGFITSWGQADWNDSSTESPSYIQNKPYIPVDISDLSDNNGLLGQGGSGFSGSYNDLTDKPTLFSGDYNDLINLPDVGPSIAVHSPGSVGYTIVSISVDYYTFVVSGNAHGLSNFQIKSQVDSATPRTWAINGTPTYDAGLSQTTIVSVEPIIGINAGDTIYADVLVVSPLDTLYAGRGVRFTGTGVSGKISVALEPDRLTSNGYEAILDANGKLTLPDALSINNYYTLPASYGATGQVLVNDGSGTLTWQDQTGGGASTGTFGFNGLTMQNTDRSDLTIRNVDLDSNTYDNELFMSTVTVDMYAYNPSLQNWSELTLNNDGSPNAQIIVAVNNTDVTWTFDNDGTTTIPGNIQTVTGSGFSFNTTIINVVTGTQTVYVDFADSLFSGPERGLVTISGVNGTPEVNGIWYYEASDPNQIALFTDSTYNTTVDGTAWTAYSSGGTAVAGGKNDLSITAGTINLVSRNTQWSFTDDGKIHLPAGGDIVDSNGVTVLGGSGGNPFDQSLNMNDSVTFANVYSGNIDVNKITSNSVTIIPVNSVYCPVNVDTIVHVSTQSLQHTIKLILKVEAQENGGLMPETQSCEMMVAKSYNNDKVAGSVYGLVYTGDAALATFNARWNSMNSTVEVTCRPTATAGDAYVSAYITEIGATLI